MAPEREHAMEWTHHFSEAGNGFPGVGDNVIIEDESGWYEIVKVATVSRIQTEQFCANMIYLTVEESELDWGALTEAEQDEAWGSLYHVDVVDDDTPAD